MTVKNKIQIFNLFSAMLLLSACATVGPDYVTPKTAVPDRWNNQPKVENQLKSTDTKSIVSWWTAFNDKELSVLIARAVTYNLDVKNAIARIREARASRGIEESGYYPNIDAGASAVRTKNTNIKSGTGYSRNLYSASADASWEFDLFGGVRRSVEAASAELQARDEDLRDTLVSLLGELAVNYIDIRTYQARIKVTEASLASRTETYQLTLWMKEADLTDQLAVEQARYSMESTRSGIPALRTGLEKALNRIAVLTGEHPGKVNDELAGEGMIPSVPIEIAVGVPADILRNRPDVRRAERKLAAQTARIGVAEAELYPKFTLSGSIGLEATGISSSGTGLVLSGGPRISWAIFKAGSIRQNIKVQSALQEQALISYESAVLVAFEEVENAIRAFTEDQQRKISLGESVQAAQKAAELAQYKFEAGLTDFSTVLEAQRSLLSFQDQLAENEGTVASDLVRLYKTLGGGWTSLAPEGVIITMPFRNESAALPGAAAAGE